MNEQEIVAIFEKANALLEGHFKLASGLHSDCYLQGVPLDTPGGRRA